MNSFNFLVSEQMRTMDKLLFLQSEIERCQQVERELTELHDLTKLECVREEILKMRTELREIQQTFERQTNEVIQVYQQQNQVFS
ncbi:MAG TPA: YgaB family protein [Chondromyces sp.]|nr:YgaB family protein [Chondromyces sp.]